MKKITVYFILLSTILTSGKVLAQNFRLGLTTSPSIAWFKSETDNYNSEGVRFGISYGLLSEFILAEQYTFATGIQVVYFGGKLSYPESDEVGTEFPSLERTYRLQNVEVPLTLKMKTREIGYNTYFARFGFGVSANLTSKADDVPFNPTTTARGAETTNEIKGQIPLFRVSMIVGIGFEHSLGGTTALVTGINFNNGFTNILKGTTLEDRNKQARANFLELSVGILF